MSTVAIHHLRDPSRPTVIPAERYDPERHTLWGDAAEPVVQTAKASSPSPEEATSADGMPDGYWLERSGSWFTVFGPDGTLVTKVQGEAAAIDAARVHVDEQERG